MCVQVRRLCAAHAAAVTIDEVNNMLCSCVVRGSAQFISLAQMCISRIQVIHTSSSMLRLVQLACLRVNVLQLYTNNFLYQGAGRERESRRRLHTSAPSPLRGKMWRISGSEINPGWTLSSDNKWNVRLGINCSLCFHIHEKSNRRHRQIDL